MKKLMALFLTLCMIFALCACGQNADPAAEGSETKEPLKIGISVPVLSNPFWRSFADFGQKYAEELGMEVTVVDANENDTTQLDQIMGLISAGVDGIVVTPNTTAIVNSIFSACEDAGVKLILAERYPGITPEEYDGDCYVGYIGVDNVMAGYNIASALYDAGARNICAIGGKQGGAVADERAEGLHKFLDEHNDMKLVQELRNAELREHGLQDAENFLSAYPDGIDGFWCYNDDAAIGAIQALTNAGMNGKILVAGMDLIDEAVAAIRAGDMLYSTGGQWAESAGAVLMLYDALNGIMPNPAVHEITIPGVTAENADAYAAQFVDSTPEYDIKALSQTLNPSAKTSDFVIELKLD